MTEEKETLTEKEIEELMELSPWELDRRYFSSDDLKKIRNTIEKLEKDLQSARGLKRFIDPGVLVNDRLVLYAKPDEYSYNIGLRAFGETEGQINVGLTVNEAKRMITLLRGAIKAAKLRRTILKLKQILKEKQRRRW